MPRPSTLLVLLLRFDGLVLSLAALAIFMPEQWMDATHRGLGMGPLPEGPLIGYLTRSISVLYFLRGLLVLLVSTDIDRYLPVIVLLGAGNLAFGVVLFGLDVAVGMPLVWTLLEGPPVALVGTAVLVLARAHRRGSVSPPRATLPALLEWP